MTSFSASSGGTGLDSSVYRAVRVRVGAEHLTPHLLAHVAFVAQHAGPEILQHAATKFLHAGKAAARPLARIVPHRSATGADFILQLLQLAQQRRRIDVLRGGRRCLGRAQVEVAAARSTWC